MRHPEYACLHIRLKDRELGNCSVPTLLLVTPKGEHWAVPARMLGKMHGNDTAGKAEKSASVACALHNTAGKVQTWPAQNT